ncbi:MAG: hypothetical protein Q9209_000742 [Squamulea sp. 1 TL-2023]
MRLLHAETLEFDDFFDTQIPPYLILSHRWGEKEVSYQQMHKERAVEGPGLTKVLNFCGLALEKRYTWVWIDTCCIDKKSSAELSEAINSMFKWYQSAEECIVYLSDVALGRLGKIEEIEASFSASVWFTRGWTLQELLAPKRLTFYDSNWKEIGDTDLLSRMISVITGIDEQFIARGASPPVPVGTASVAARMSWVAKRKTSRSEDIAYCLLGIFDVNMPLLYGEGAEKAFIRLQTEIINISDDETIFAWTSNQRRSGMLATDPSFFAYSKEVVNYRAVGQTYLRFWMTNKGLAFQIPDSEWSAGMKLGPGWGFNIGLNSRVLQVQELKDDETLGIRVERFSTRNTWRRIDCQSLRTVRKRYVPIPDKKPLHTIYFPQSDGGSY